LAIVPFSSEFQKFEAEASPLRSKGYTTLCAGDACGEKRIEQMRMLLYTEQVRSEVATVTGKRKKIPLRDCEPVSRSVCSAHYSRCLGHSTVRTPGTDDSRIPMQPKPHQDWRHWMTGERVRRCYLSEASDFGLDHGIITLLFVKSHFRRPVE